MSLKEKKLSGAMRIFEALSNVDEELLAKCENGVQPAVRKRKILRYTGTLTAAACILVVCIALWRTGGYEYAAKDTAGGRNEAAEAPAASAEAQAVEEKAIDTETQAIAEEILEDVGESIPETVQESEKEQTGAGNEGGTAKQPSDSTDAGSMKQGSTQDLNQEMEQAAVTEALKDSRVDITETEARQLTTIGKYIPTRLPAGYVWESGKTYAEEKNSTGAYVSLNWVKGMDSIHLTISTVEWEDVLLTDITAKETYDVRLYEIPYAETVPEEYREIFNEPIFAEEDFTKEVIEARMKVVADQGDTNTPRGQFAVLYEDGVLVRFNGRGTAEEIWEMFQSIQ